MVSIEKTAKTAEEAIELALAELGVPRDRVEVEVLEEGRALFGILGSAQARVRVTAETTIGERASQVLAEMLQHMGLEATPEVTEEDDTQAIIDIRGEDLGLLIGKHGQTLAAVQHLVGLMANRGEENRKRIILDAEGYRERREESLRHLAIASARKAKQSGEAITLDPLLPHERRIIHTTLADDADVMTRSVGEDPTRRIVIEPRGGRSGDSRRREQPAFEEPEGEEQSTAATDEFDAERDRPAADSAGTEDDDGEMPSGEQES